MYISEARFNGLFTSFERSAFRLQLLPEYTVESERPEYARFLAGEALPQRNQVPWLDTMRHQVDVGRTWTNIHLLPATLTPYLRYLLDWWYVYQDRAGASIGFLSQRYATPIQALAMRDFWLFDDALLLVLHYDSRGRFLGAVEVSSDAALSAAGRARNFAVANATSLRDVLANRRSDRPL